jgi:beta-lactam-binding protein with PASTA domain
MPLLVDVKSNSPSLGCEAGATVECAFDVTNKSGRRLRLGVEALGETKPWVALEDKLKEFDLPEKGQQKIAVTVSVPADAKAKTYSVKVRVYDIATTEAAESEAVGLAVTVKAEVKPVVEPKKEEKKKVNVALIVAAAIGGVVLIGGIVTAIILLTGGGTVPNVTTADVAKPIMLADAVAALEKEGLKTGTVSEQVGDAPAGAVIGQTPKGGEAKPENGTVDLVVAMVTVEVPRVETFTVSAARNVLKTAGFADEVRVEATGRSLGGTVIRQEPAAGTRALANSVVVLTVEKELAVVPNVVGLGPKPAEDALAAAELKYKLRGTVNSGGTRPPGTVTVQEPAEGASVDKGTEVLVDIEMERITVPNVVGQALGDATLNLGRAKLSVAPSQPIYFTDPPFQTVHAQNPAAGASVTVGTDVVLSVRTQQLIRIRPDIAILQVSPKLLMRTAPEIGIRDVPPEE